MAKLPHWKYFTATAELAKSKEAAPKRETNAEASNLAVLLGGRCYRRSGAFAADLGRAR